MTPTTLPMLFSNLHLIHVDPVDKPPPSLPNQQIVPTHHSLSHSPFRIKRPILKPIASLPQHPVFCVLILVPELHGDLTFAKRKQFFAKAVTLLAPPFLDEKLVDCGRSLEEGISVPPDRVWSVCGDDVRGFPVDPSQIVKNDLKWQMVLTGCSKLLGRLSLLLARSQAWREA